jgi:peptide/nickel transport system permease protein
MGESMSSRQDKLKFNIKRVAGFFRAMLRSKRGVFGLCILIVAVIVALGAPLITPYNPIWSVNLASKLAPPAWMRYIPGSEGLSQNMIPVDESSLLQSANPLNEFNFTVTGTDQAISNTATVNQTLSAYSVSISPTWVALNVSQPQTFTSTVSGGTAPYEYQWYLDGEPVSGANESTWTFTPSWPLGILTYSVYVQVQTASFQVANSNTATVSLEGLLFVSISPTSVTLNVDQSQVFTSNVSGGTGLYSYQWFLNGTSVPGADEANWTFTPTSRGSCSVYLKVTDNIGIQVSQDITVQDSAFGAAGSNGSLEIIFQAPGLPINSSLTYQIMRDFHYPYSGTPGALIMNGTLLASRIDGFAISPRTILEQKWLKLSPQGTASYNVTDFEWGWNNYANRGQGGRGPVTYSANNLTGDTVTSTVLGWQTPQPALPIYDISEDPFSLKQLFPTTGTYSYGMGLTVTKLTAQGEAIVYVSNVKLKLLGSSWGLLGTDAEGRDVFTQLVYGTQVSLYVGLVAAFLSTIIGLIVGLVAAYVGGIVDEILMRFTDALLVLPGLPLMIVLIYALSAGQYNINILIIVFGFLGWQGFARLVRSQVLSLKERPYVEAAKAVGAGTPYILWRHILPNVVVLIYVTLALTVPAAIVTEAAFAFLGFQDLSHMSWGRMLTSLENNPGIWWIVIPPGLAIMILSLSFILIGYAIDDILNPKLRVRR